MIQPMAVKASQTARIAPRIVQIVRLMHPVCARRRGGAGLGLHAERRILRPRQEPSSWPGRGAAGCRPAQRVGGLPSGRADRGDRASAAGGGCRPCPAASPWSAGGADCWSGGPGPGGQRSRAHGRRGAGVTAFAAAGVWWRLQATPSIIMGLTCGDEARNAFGVAMADPAPGDDAPVVLAGRRQLLLAGCGIALTSVLAPGTPLARPGDQLRPARPTGQARLARHVDQRPALGGNQAQQAWPGNRMQDHAEPGG